MSLQTIFNSHIPLDVIDIYLSDISEEAKSIESYLMELLLAAGEMI